jgi:NAD(P)-dependent dehydrogenase (short-subunit alcohol dehydrogenase family)
MNKIDQKQIIVMTGATGGIGAHALKRLAARANTEVIVGARGGRDLPGASVLPLELGSVQSTRDFAEAVKQHLGDTKINMLVLNAGAQFRQAERSADGFEMTFAVNHLSHYLLARLSTPEMAERGRIVITTSDTHDPRKTPLAPRTLDPESLAHPTKDSPARAYPASKLCNLLTAESLAASGDVKERQISVIAYNPGLTGGTSLGGGSALQHAVMAAMRPVLRFLSVFLSQLYMSTAEQSGDALAQLVLGQVIPPPGRVYASHVRGKITFPDPSQLAQSDDARDLLWRRSAAMVDLPV